MSESIETQIRMFITQFFPLAAGRKLSSQDALLENGVIDSLGVLDLVSFIEQTFAVMIMDEELVPENFQTIERLAAFVQSKHKEKGVR